MTLSSLRDGVIPCIYWTQYQEPGITLRMARNDDTLWYFKSPRWKIAHLVGWFMPRMYLLPTRLITEHGTLTAGLKKQGVTRQRRYENWHDGHPETHQDGNWSFGHNLGVGVLEDNKTTQPKADQYNCKFPCTGKIPLHPFPLSTMDWLRGTLNHPLEIHNIYPQYPNSFQPISSNPSHKIIPPAIVGDETGHTVGSTSVIRTIQKLLPKFCEQFYDGTYWCVLTKKKNGVFLQHPCVAINCLCLILSTQRCSPNSPFTRLHLKERFASSFGLSTQIRVYLA